MTDLEKAICKTLAYFDIFEYPLTLLEVKKWLWEYKEDDLWLIKNSLTNLAKQNRLVEKDGFYCWPGRQENVATRLERYRLAEEKIKKARKYITILSGLPYLRGIFICNNLAWHNSRPDSDIDLLITVKPGKIWTARFLATTLVKLLGLRPTPGQRRDKLCLSFFLTEDNLNTEKLKIKAPRDIYLTYWLDQLIPWYQTQDAYGKLRRANSVWLRKYLPQSYGFKLAPATRIKKTAVRRWFKKQLERTPGENLFRYLQWKILPDNLKKAANQDTRVVISDRILKFHDPDNREKYQNRWENKIGGLDESPANTSLGS